MPRLFRIQLTLPFNSFVLQGLGALQLIGLMTRIRQGTALAVP
jgi:hypothetical protein